MKKVIKVAVFGFVFLGFFNTVHAALNVDAQVDVPASCTVTDTNHTVHNYPDTGSYLAICAIEKALEQNAVSSVDFADFGFGLFINSINGIAPTNTYWKLELNNTSSNVGASDLTLNQNDTLSLALTAYDPVTFAETPAGDQVTLHIHLPTVAVGSGPLLLSSSTAPSTSSAPAAPTEPAQPVFDAKKASEFLAGVEHGDGSFGANLYTDWAAIAMASGNNQDAVLKLVKYFDTSKLDSSLLTDYERHAMALMTLGLNPYDVNGENYIKKIVTTFDGKQFGDAGQDNDDIFALIVLQNAGYGPNDPMLASDINFVLDAQSDSGAWDGSADMTGAAMEALSAFSSDARVKNSLIKAENFLRLNQKDDASWNENASSTAWAIEGILAMDEKPEAWIKNDATPLGYLAGVQDSDGGIKNASLNNKIWETAYAISALSGKSWNETMQKFDKPAEPVAVEAPASAPAETVAPGSAISESNPVAVVSRPKKTKPETKNASSVTAKENTATALNALAEPNSNQQTATTSPKKNWFWRLLDSLFQK